jgi:type IV pilus assembly protein PilC
MDVTVDLQRIIAAQRPSKAEQKRGGSLVDRVAPFLRRKVSEREKAEFCMQLAVMLRSRISLHRALHVLAEQTKGERSKGVVESLEQEIQKGSSFSHALANQRDVFEQLFAVTAEVGQETGRLADVLMNLAQHLEKVNALKKKFVQALTYPALVLCVACCAVGFLLMFIVPTFAEMFKSFQVELPLSTRAVLGLSGMFVDYGPYVVLTLVVLLFMSRSTLRAAAVSQRLESLSFKVPIIGDIIVKNYVARFCRTLGTLLQAQVSLVEALGVSQQIISNPEIKAEVGRILRHVKQGSAVGEQMLDSHLFPPMVAHMITVGEETSELDAMLIKVAEYYENELDRTVETLASVIEPVIVLFLGLIVASILIAMYLPMFDLVNVMGGS